MQLIHDLEQVGIDVYISSDGKLKYRGRQPPNGRAVFLLAELKKRKNEVIQHLQDNRMDAEQAIQQAWDKTLRQSVLIECKPEFAELWGGPVWLCSTDEFKKQIRRKYPNDFTLSADEFFQICGGLADNQDMQPVIDACRLFGGDLKEKEAL